jgi:hypothetical protein
MFGILQIILSTPTIQNSISNPSSTTPPLDQILFLQTLKFSQLSDEIVNLWLDDISTVTEEYEESTGRISVRAAVSTCASEVYPPIYLTRISLTTLWIIGWSFLSRLGGSMIFVKGVNGRWRAEEAALFILSEVLEGAEGIQSSIDQIHRVIDNAMSSSSLSLSVGVLI